MRADRASASPPRLRIPAQHLHSANAGRTRGAYEPWDQSPMVLRSPVTPAERPRFTLTTLRVPQKSLLAYLFPGPAHALLQLSRTVQRLSPCRDTRLSGATHGVREPRPHRSRATPLEDLVELGPERLRYDLRQTPLRRTLIQVRSAPRWTRLRRCRNVNRVGRETVKSRPSRGGCWQAAWRRSRCGRWRGGFGPLALQHLHSPRTRQSRSRCAPPRS